MKPQLTAEQQTILDYCESNYDNNELVLINAVAGSGKTTMLRAIADTLPNTNSLYLAYNKAIAMDSKKKFPSSVHCKTTHSLALAATKPELKFQSIENFSWRNLPKSIKRHEDKLEIVDNLTEFCLSKSIDWEKFAKAKRLSELVTTTGGQFLSDIYEGKQTMTHEMYLKIFHIWLANGHISYDQPFDLLMLDEAGDLNEVTLEIFKLLPAKLKIAVGDQHQNIYSFNHTINCFGVLKGEGKMFSMTQSFRVSPNIAKKVERFCDTYLQKDMVFTGTPQHRQITTKAYITRTNSAMIARMIDLNAISTPYTLVRSAKEIFKLPLMVCSFKHKGFIADPSYKFLQKDINDYYETPIKERTHKTLLGHLKASYPDDIALSQALKLVMVHGVSDIVKAFEEAKKHEKVKTNYTICTAHSSKGLEFDEVELGDDMNMAVQKLFKPGKEVDSTTIRETLNLYYVAITRASIKLDNATILT